MHLPTQVRNFKRAGFASERFGIWYSPPRTIASFAGQRERQLLKQLSTMIYFNMPRNFQQKSQTITLAEIESMHVKYGEKNFLFIAGNEAPLTTNFDTCFSVKKNFQKKITQKPKKYPPTDEEGKQRVERYSTNLEKIIYHDELPFEEDEKDTEEDLARCREIGDLLRDKTNPTVLTLEYEEPESRAARLTDKFAADIHAILDSFSQIVFLDTSNILKKLHKRHAEEFLVDIAKIIRSYAGKSKSIHIAIAGKKRPCTTCYSRMKSSKLIDAYGTRPGFFWEGRYKEQINLTPSAAKESIKTLSKDASYVTVNNEENELAGYDSGTEEAPKVKK